MTTLLEFDAPDVEDAIVCWLQSVIRAAVERETDDVMPFCVVTRVAGDDDEDCGFNSAVIQLDVFALGVPAVKDATKVVRRRMNQLSRELDDITLTDNSVVSVNSVANQIDFTRLPYAHDLIVRYMARYWVGLVFVAA